MIQKFILFLATFVLSLTWSVSAQKPSNTDTSDDIRIIAILDVHAGKWDAFKKIAAECKQAVEAKDKGTLQYDWFYNDAQTECIVIEHYIDSDAVLEHSANAGEILGRLAQVSTLSLEIYGKPSEKLKKALAGKKVTFYNVLF